MTAGWILEHEPIVRVAAFAGVFALVALLELAAARRELVRSKARRWATNLALAALNTVIMRIAFPVAAIGAAALAEARGWGLLHWIDLPLALAIVASVVLLDLAIYFQHVLMHAVPILWRLHRVHHADTDFDVTTGVRFHPFEILVSMGFKLALVVVIGPPILGVLLFEVLLNATSMFNHANARLPRSVDALLRWFVVTPDMHRVHHSANPAETNSNFGFNLPWWDRLFGTYRDQPSAGHDAMIVGLHHLPAARSDGLLALLFMPFSRPIGDYPIGRRS